MFFAIRVQAIAEALPGIPASARRTPTRVSRHAGFNISPPSPVKSPKIGFFGIFGRLADEVVLVSRKDEGSGGGADLASETDRGQGTGEAAVEGGSADRDTTAADEGSAPSLGQDGDPVDKDTAVAGDDSAPAPGLGGDSVRLQVEECAIPAKTSDNGSVVPSSFSPPATGSSSLSPAETAWSILSRGKSESVGASVSGDGVGSSGGGVDGGDVIADEEGDGGDGAVVVFQLLMQRWELRPWVVGPRTLVATKEQVQCASDCTTHLVPIGPHFDRSDNGSDGASKQR